MFSMTLVFALTSGCNDEYEENRSIKVPQVSATEISNIGSSVASAKAKVLFIGSSKVTAYGFCWGQDSLPTLFANPSTYGVGNDTFIGQLGALLPESKFFVRAYAINESGVGYGSCIAFVTQKKNVTELSDLDGNIYHVLVIGNQSWLIENWKCTKFRNGSSIDYPGNANGAWQTNSSGAYAWYNNDPSNKDIYGALYNAIAVANPIFGIAGWHVATDDDFINLGKYLNGDDIAGGQMKEKGLLRWATPNTAASNSSGFTGAAGGGRNLDGSFLAMGNNANFWTSTSFSSTDFWARYLYYGDGKMYRSHYNKNLGFSVRLVKD